MLKIERFSAERGDAQSQYFMGEHYEYGDSGVSKDLTIALSWYRKAAAQGSGAAQYKIGLFHEEAYLNLNGGKEVAIEWYKKAAENGSEQAVVRLAEFQKAEQDVRKKEAQLKAEIERQRQLQVQREKERERNKMLRASKPVMAALPLKVNKTVVKEVFPVEQTMKWMLDSRWVFGGKPAEYLPAEDMSCLKTAVAEITCFSRERTKVLNSSKVTYSVKSVLTDFKQDGHFSTTYHFNVTGMDKADTPVSKRDMFGLKVAQGWQQPGVIANCRINRQRHIECESEQHQNLKFDVR